MPLRSGNSWMSVAPFRDLETANSLKAGVRARPHAAPCPLGKCPHVPLVTPALRRAAGFAEQPPAQMEPAASAFRPQFAKKTQARNWGRVKGRLCVRGDSSGAPEQALGCWVCSARDGVSPKLSSAGASPELWTASSRPLQTGGFPVPATPSCEDMHTSAAQKTCCRTPSRQRGAWAPPEQGPRGSDASRKCTDSLLAAPGEEGCNDKHGAEA